MSVPRLSRATLEQAAARKPRYDRAQLRTGIVHLGLGAFHRAHQAVYTEDCLDAGDMAWGIAGASLRASDTRDALLPQDGLYTVVARENEARELRVVGALRAMFVATESPSRLLDTMCLPSVKIVSLTVTEKGYCLEPSSGALNEDDPGVRRDLASPAAPRTAPGFIVEAIARRRMRGLAPFTVLSCDNLSHNGRTTQKLLARFAQLRDPELGKYVADEIACPDTMVDRIVPATTDEDRARVSREIGVADAWPVMTEAFTQWVIADRFPEGRPQWEAAGALMVSDVAPFELMKLRLLNGSHSAIAYLGQLAGLDTVADVMATEIAEFVGALMDDARATLPAQPPTGLADYKASLLARFRNRALMHRTQQIAMDGSMKLPQRIVQPVADALTRGLPVRRHALVVAAWIAFLQGANERGEPLAISDPMAEMLTRIARQSSPADLVGEMLDVRAVFGDTGQDPRLRETVTDALAALKENGARETAKRYAAVR